MIKMIVSIMMNCFCLQGICVLITTGAYSCRLIRVIAKNKVYDKGAGFCYDLFERSKAAIDGIGMNEHMRARFYRYSWLMMRETCD